MDAPLLYETKLLEYFCYPILVVYCDNNQEQLRRLMQRNPEMSEEEALRRVSAQMPIGVKVRKADIAIDNSGTEKQLRKQVLDTVIPKIY